jgi:hypothetical protein
MDEIPGTLYPVGMPTGEGHCKQKRRAREGREGSEEQRKTDEDTTARDDMIQDDFENCIHDMI